MKEVVFESLYAEPSRNGLTKPRSVRGTGYKMINMGELFAYGRINNPVMDLVPLTSKELQNFQVKKGDLLFARQSLIASGAGKCSIVIDCPVITVFESHLIRVRLNPEKCNPLFYYYYFSSPIGIEKTQSLVSQVAAAGIRGSELAKLNVHYIEKKYQDKIAKVLSNYDDLIENNNKRIKILEEMAQKIYKEWFVDFKYPGHETATFKDTELGKLVMPKKGKNITKATIKEGNIPVVAGGLEPAYYHNVANTVAPVITISASGANAGYVKLYYEDIWASDCSYIDNQMTPYVYYFYLYLKYNQIKVTNLQKGAAQPHVYPQDLATLKIMNIDENVIKEFNSIVTPLFEEIKNIILKNKILRQTRDLLLPRLMSGEISVENLEIA